MTLFLEIQILQKGSEALVKNQMNVYKHNQIYVTSTRHNA